MQKIVLCLMIMWFGVIPQSAVGKSVATKVALLPITQRNIWGLEFSPDNTHVAIGSRNTISIWDWQKNVVRAIEMPPGSNPSPDARPLQYSADGKLLAILVNGANNLQIRILDTENWNVEKDVIELGTGHVEVIAFTKDSNYLLVGKTRFGPGDSLVAYDRKTWLQVWGMDLGLIRPKFLRVSPDGLRVAMSGILGVLPPPTVTDEAERSRLYKTRSQTYIIRLPERKIEHVLEGEARGTVAWNASSDHVVILGQMSFEMYDVRTGLLLKASKEDGQGHTAAEYTMDGRYYIDSDADALHNGKGIHIWDAAKSHVLQSIPGDSFCMDVSLDSKFLVTDAGDGAQVWRLD